MQYQTNFTDLKRNSPLVKSKNMLFNYLPLRNSSSKNENSTKMVFIKHHTSHSFRLIKTLIHLPLMTSIKFICGLLMTFQQLLPLNITSRIWGWLNSIDLPIILRKPVYSLYSWVYGCHLEEMIEPDLKKYKNLSEFFRRAIRSECRPINMKAILVSPVDARVVSFGPLKPGQMQNVKGISYTLSGFLGPISWHNSITTKKSINRIKSSISKSSSSLCTTNTTNATTVPQFSKMINHRDYEDNSKTRGGVRQTNKTTLNIDTDSYYMEKLCLKEGTRLYHIVLYLAPGDYHRFHSAADWSVTYRRHFPGKLYSVNPLFTSWMKNLFCLNERACYIGEWEYGFFSTTAVGANNVGSINVGLDPELRTNRPSSRVMRGAVQSWNFLLKRGTKAAPTIDPPLRQRYYDVDFPYHYELNRGDLFGEFNLGSTIVLIFEAPNYFEFNVELDQTVQVGQELGSAFKNGTTFKNNSNSRATATTMPTSSSF